MNYRKYIAELADQILSGNELDFTQAATLMNIPDSDIMSLAAAADAIRIHFKGFEFDACSLINARSGRCSEDCAFCSQSGHHNGDCEVYDLKGTEEILSAAKAANRFGASRFCTVTSGGALSDTEFDALIESLKTVNQEVNIELDASLGFIDDSRANRLLAAGVKRYNHNLETAPNYYESICSTHNFKDRVATVETVIGHGFSACSGGIIGMGESLLQRLELAFAIKSTGIDCVPINILNPRPGTPLENTPPVPPLEIIKTIAVFRFVLPCATIKIAGGRERNLGDFQGLALRAGANGMIIGGYLTTSGRQVEDDLNMVRQAGFHI